MQQYIPAAANRCPGNTHTFFFFHKDEALHMFHVQVQYRKSFDEEHNTIKNFLQKRCHQKFAIPEVVTQPVQLFSKKFYSRI